MFDINNLTIAGRLTRDPETQNTNTGKSICKFSIATNEGKDKTSFFDVVCFDKLAETVIKYCKKGAAVGIVGKIKQDRWTDKEGKSHSKVTITANSIYFLGSKPQENKSSNVMAIDDFNSNDFSDGQEIPF